MTNLWDAAKADLAPDGSLRDIYVFGTSVSDWQKVLTFLARTYHPVQLSSQQREVVFPEVVTAEDFGGSTLLTFRAGQVNVSSHFFLQNTIELSFAPNDLRASEDLEALLVLMVQLGTLLGREVLVTPENLPEHPFFVFRPGDPVVRYIASVTL